MPAMHSWLSVPHSQRIGTRGEGANLVRPHPLQMFALAEGCPGAAEELVSGADQKIAVERSHVDEAVRAVVHGVHVGKRPETVGKANDILDGIDGADCNRG